MTHLRLAPAERERERKHKTVNKHEHTTCFSIDDIMLPLFWSTSQSVEYNWPSSWYPIVCKGIGIQKHGHILCCWSHGWPTLCVNYKHEKKSYDAHDFESMTAGSFQQRGCKSKRRWTSASLAPAGRHLSRSRACVLFGLVFTQKDLWKCKNSWKIYTETSFLHILL